MPGDTIWLFSQLIGPWGRLLPALDARIEVAEVRRISRENKMRCRYAAGTGSCWFALSDARSLLSTLHARRADGTRTPIIQHPRMAVGQSLRLLRRADDASPLLEYAEDLDARGQDFVSYRLIDGTRDAFALVERLLHEGRSVFWDRWSLPRRLAERRETIDDAALDAFIAGQIRRSTRVHGILSPRYADPDSYSYRERMLAEQLGVFVPHPFADLTSTTARHPQ
jgi:hypothetical protein